MKQVVKADTEEFGPFTTIIQAEDGLLCDGLKIPFSVIGEVWTVIEYVNTEVIAETPKVSQITMRQARLVLLKHELLDDIDLIISNSDRASKIEWEYAQTVDREHPIIEVVRLQKGLTVEYIDKLFYEASTL